MSHTSSQFTARPADVGRSTRTLPELEEELLGLAGHLAAAQCRFLRVLAEFDDRAGWAGAGLKSCAHWLSWRIGMSLRTAHEHVRVAHALRELPKIDEAFAGGRISYSKVRAITRLCGRRPEPQGDSPTSTIWCWSAPFIMRCCTTGATASAGRVRVGSRYGPTAQRFRRPASRSSAASRA